MNSTLSGCFWLFAAKFWKVVSTYKWYLSFCECKFRGGGTQRWWGGLYEWRVVGALYIYIDMSGYKGVSGHKGMHSHKVVNSYKGVSRCMGASGLACSSPRILVGGGKDGG